MTFTTEDLKLPDPTGHVPSPEDPQGFEEDVQAAREERVETLYEGAEIERIEAIYGVKP